MTLPLLQSPWLIITNDDQHELILDRDQEENVTRSKIINRGTSPSSLQEAVICKWTHELSPDTRIFGEGFQMLSQTGGTLTEPLPIGRCDDGEIYRLYDASKEKRVYNLLVMEGGGKFTLLAFTSCNRFSGFFRLSPSTIEVVADLEGVQLTAGEEIWLEEFICLQGSDLNLLLQKTADQLGRNHPRKLPEKIPAGWCSWYHYYAGVTAGDIRENLSELKAWPDLEYVQIDDGYQARMGDWLTPSDKFTGGVKALINEIRNKGKKAGIWVAPFIAEPDSEVFRNHPDWFVKNEDGIPLAAEEVTYGGWRCTPWYVLDGTHPEAIAHIKRVFSVMRKEWGVAYFKLDANFWGAIHGGQFYRKGSTRVEAYREGMKAINEAAGGAFILGCNAPMWASLGLVDGMRVSDDVERRQERFIQTREETFRRNWLHKKLWLNDPDCLVLRNLTDQEATQANFRFHLATILGSGGILMAGDRLSILNETQRKQLSQVLWLRKQKYSAGKFTGLDLQQSWCEGPDGNRLLCLTNSAAESRKFSVDIAKGQVLNPVIAGDYQLAEDKLSLILAPVDGAVFELTGR